MTRFVIHVGPHKTGTTYLQQSFARNREALLREGIYYPTDWTGSEITWCHVGLVEALKRNDDEAIIEPLSRIKAAGYDVVMLSCEDLAGLGERSLQALCDALDARAEIVFYTRRWSEVLRSSVQELIRHGSTSTLGEFCASVLAAPFESEWINFVLRLDRFSSIFGKESLKIISYNNVVDHGEDLFQHFLLSVLRRPVQGMEMVEPVHRSPSIYESELLRVMNVFRQQYQMEGARWRAGRVIRAIERAKLPLVRSAMERSVLTLIINELARPLADIYEATLERYGGCVVCQEGTKPADVLFERRNVAVRYVQPNYLLDPVILGELADLFLSVVADPGNVNPLIDRSTEEAGALPNKQPIVLFLEFGAGGNSANYLGRGWSKGEPGFRWMVGDASELWLDRPEVAGDHILEVEVSPYLHPPTLRSQRLAIYVRDKLIGRSEVSERQTVMRLPLPAALLTGPGPIRVVLQHPDAVKPVDLGHSSDKRALSLAVRRMSVRRASQAVAEVSIA